MKDSRADEERAGGQPDVEDPDFQRRWLEAREGLDEEQVEAAWRHGFEARDRFADRPFDEVRDWLRQSWEAMGPPADWEKVEDLIEGGYDRYKGAGFGVTDPAPEALREVDRFTAGGGHTGPGDLGERPQLGAAERTPPERPRKPGS